MKALIVKAPGEAVVGDVPEPIAAEGDAVLQVRMVGMWRQRPNYLSRKESHCELSPDIGA
jgi:hypothetical protein